MVNTKIALASRPKGIVEDSNFEKVTETLSDLQTGEVLVQIEAISLDPAIRGWMNAGTTYIKGIEIGAVIRTFSAGKVIDSKSDAFMKGDYVSGLLGAQEYCIATEDQLTKIDISKGKASLHLGILGMPGMTAYFGLLEKGKPQAGETIYVSGAAGIVGSIVGQIAKIKGCTVIGSAGSDTKCQYLIDDCGFDHAINYKNEDIDQKLKEYAPEGLDIFFDNVGGPTLDAGLLNLARGARIVICGFISQYNKTEIYGPKNYGKIVLARGTLTGVIVFDHVAEWPTAVNQISKWINAEKLYAKEHVVEGLEKFPMALKMLYTGENFGKLVLTV